MLKILQRSLGSNGKHSSKMVPWDFCPRCKILSPWCRHNDEEVVNVFSELINMGFSVGTGPVEDPLKKQRPSWSQRFESQEGLEGWAVHGTELHMAPWSWRHFPVQNRQQCEDSAVNCMDMNSINKQVWPIFPQFWLQIRAANTLISTFSRRPRNCDTTNLCCFTLCL